MHYADYAVGKLIEAARKKPWFKDTVFVFVADHTAGSAGKVEINPQRYHIPFIVYAPGYVQPRVVSSITSQIDVPPVILGQLGFSYISKFFGRDSAHEPAAEPYAYISTYQKVAMLNDKQLITLGPKRSVAVGSAQNGDPLADVQPEPALLQRAIALYQSASHWRETQQRVPTVIPPASAPARLPNAQ